MALTRPAKEEARGRFRGDAGAPSVGASPNPDLAVVAAWPSLRRAAEILHVAVSSLSRANLPVESRGREKRVSPRVVLGCAAYYRRRPLGEVAGDLASLALEQAPEVAEVVERDIEQALRALQTAPPADALGWLEDARRTLSGDAYAAVEAIVRQDAPLISSRVADR